jgi:hypothetical protein
LRKLQKTPSSVVHILIFIIFALPFEVVPNPYKLEQLHA